MKEGSWTAKLLYGTAKNRRDCLHGVLPNATIWKWSDRINAGRPDLSITIETSSSGTRTVWVEIKVVPGGRIFIPLQLEELKRVDGWYCIWFMQAKRGLLFKARECPEDLTAALETESLTYIELLERMKRLF